MPSSKLARQIAGYQHQVGLSPRLPNFNLNYAQFLQSIIKDDQCSFSNQLQQIKGYIPCFISWTLQLGKFVVRYIIQFLVYFDVLKLLINLFEEQAANIFYA
jgi:hypothetical protein